MINFNHNLNKEYFLCSPIVPFHLTRKQHALTKVRSMKSSSPKIKSLVMKKPTMKTLKNQRWRRTKKYTMSMKRRRTAYLSLIPLKIKGSHKKWHVKKKESNKHGIGKERADRMSRKNFKGFKPKEMNLKAISLSNKKSLKNLKRTYLWQWWKSKDLINKNFSW